MSLEIALRLLTGVFLIAANGFFVATEFALTRLRQFPKKDFESHAGLRRAWKMTDELEIYLTGCQVGITFTSILLGIVVEPAMTHVMQPLLTMIGVGESTAHGAGLVVGLVLINLAHTIWAEQTPTYLGVEKSKLVAKYCAIPHLWWTRAVYPLLFIGDAMAKWSLRLFGIEMNRSWTEHGDEPEDGSTDNSGSRADLLKQMGSLMKKGELKPDRRNEVLQAVRIDTIPVREAMVPRDSMVALRTSDPFSESVAKVGGTKHTRYPLVGEEPEDFRGFVYLPEVFAHLNALIDGQTKLEDIAIEPIRVSADTNVSDLIDELQDADHEIALVTESDRVVGLVTLTDAVELIVGDSRDPLDVLVAEAENV